MTGRTEKKKKRLLFFWGGGIIGGLKAFNFGLLFVVVVLPVIAFLTLETGILECSHGNFLCVRLEFRDLYI